MRNFLAIASTALLLAGCSASDEAQSSAPAPAASETEAGASAPAPSATPSASASATTSAPAATATTTAPELSATELVFVTGARQYWPNETDPDALLLATADMACSWVALQDLDQTTETIQGLMPAETTVDQAAQFTIYSVMTFCPEHDDKLPG